MTSEAQAILLQNPDLEPADSVIKNALGENKYAVYKEILNIITSEFQLDPQWRYYKDGKAWMCKVTSRKKTILWLSIWEGFIRVAFYFTEKTGSGLVELEIDEQLKESFRSAKPVGKLIPLVMDIGDHSLYSDLRHVINYKKSLK